MKGPGMLFSETEAAHRLGLPVEQFRTLVRNHLGEGDEIPENTRFQLSDLVALQFLAGGTQKIAVC